MKLREANTVAANTGDTLPALGLLARLGERVLRVIRAVLMFVGDASVALARGFVPGRWRRTMREELFTYFYHVGVRAVPAVVVAALLVGIGLVQQILYWLDVAGQQGSVGSFLVLVLVREISPVVTALIVIGRSGSVLLDEVGHMKVNGQLRMLQSVGLDPVDLIAIPRCFAMSLAVCVLTIIFLYAALWSGYLMASLTGLTSISLLSFVDSVLSGMTIGDHLLLVIKPLVTGYVIAYIAVWFGMRVEANALAVRRMLPRGFVYSLIATFLIGATVSAVL